MEVLVRASLSLACLVGCADAEPRVVKSATVSSSATPSASSAPPPVVSAPVPTVTAVAPAPRAMVALPGGRYTVGAVNTSVDGTPLSGLRPRTTVVEAFELDVTEVTVEAFRRCVEGRACDDASLGKEALCNAARSDRLDHPVNCVPFTQAEAYCAWEGKRLPTEMEWEIAASLELPVMKPLDLHGEVERQICKTSEYSTEGVRDLVGTCVVGSRKLKKSKLGLADMMGNVSEWTSSHFCNQDTPLCRSRIIRGSAWHGDYYESYHQRFLEPGRTLNEGSRLPTQVGIRCAR